MLAELNLTRQPLTPTNILPNITVCVLHCDHQYLVPTNHRISSSVPLLLLTCWNVLDQDSACPTCFWWSVQFPVWYLSVCEGEMGIMYHLLIKSPLSALFYSLNNWCYSARCRLFVLMLSWSCKDSLWNDRGHSLWNPVLLVNDRMLKQIPNIWL